MTKLEEYFANTKWDVWLDLAPLPKKSVRATFKPVVDKTKPDEDTEPTITD